MPFQPAPFLAGDRVADVTNWLRPLVVGHVGNSLEGWSGGPAVRITRSGGRIEGTFERVDMQFDVYGDSGDAIFDTCTALRNHLVTAALNVAGCVQARELQGPIPVPDEVRDVVQDRMVMDWSFRFRGLIP